jgi:hypothetical protein
MQINRTIYGKSSRRNIGKKKTNNIHTIKNCDRNKTYNRKFKNRAFDNHRKQLRFIDAATIPNALNTEENNKSF